MTQPATPPENRASASTSSSTPPSAYERPTIIHRGKLELRAGSPLAIDPDGFPDLNNPFK